MNPTHPPLRPTPSWAGRVRRVTAAGTATAVLAASVVVATPAQAQEAFTGPRDDLRRDQPVPVSPVKPAEVAVEDPQADLVWDGQPAALPPQPGIAVFDLDDDTGSATSGDAMPVKVQVMPQYRHAVPQAPLGSVRVEVLDQQAARAAGVSGLLVAVTGTGQVPVELGVDYSSFADLFGGAWAQRLRWVELPACAASTPQVAGCVEVTPHDSRLRPASAEVSTTLMLQGPSTGADTGDGSDVRLLALTADPGSEGAGDYRATDLSPAGSWTSGGNDGSFTYSYPLRLPPAAGPAPSVGLGYSSASHDGRTSGSNNQASWAGDGWGYQPGFIERSYTPCASDSDGGNTPDQTGDLCWDGDSPNVTISLNGTNTSLVLDDDTDVWRAAADPNWRIELLGSPAAPGSATTERWKVTTTDGTRYFFSSEVSSSSSRLTVPVFGNHTGEACHATGFADSSCRQAYRWMLDKVVDVHGNMSRYFYLRESGHYGAAADPDNRVAYHRAALVERIEYGLRADDSSIPATGRVLFEVADRCLQDCGTASAPNTENWPDTPWDLDCDTAPCTSQHSPVFFTTKRLVTVTTQVHDGAGFADVDSWQLEHKFLDYGDDEQVVLWLDSIQHTGHAGGQDITTPKVEFTGEALPNRVDAAPGVPVMWRSRMFAIKTETGAVITVDYQPTECTPTNLPANAHTNSMRCYPVRWTPPFQWEPIEDWFHKHVVAGVVQTDTTGGQVAVETSYEYATTGGGTSVLWAFDDSEFTDDEHRTYGMWRGYPQITTLVGDPAEGQTRTRSRFYRGMDGQPLPSGSRSVQLSDDEGNTVTDHEALTGRLFETLTYDDTTVVSGTTTGYWTRKTATRQRDHDGGDQHAWMTAPSTETSRTLLVGTTWQRTETRTTRDNHGRPIEVNSLGDTATTGDEYCTRTEYADNTTDWIMNTVKRTETVSVDCATSPSRPDDLISDQLTYYDGSNTHGSPPVKGLPTRVDVVDHWDGGPVYVTTARSSYDSLGRVVSASDALDRTTTTTYTPAGAGPLTQTTTTNPLGHQNVTELEPAWGLLAATVEPNGRRTDLAYDGLGRLTSVWLPGRNPDTHTASMTFAYLIRNDGPSAVTTRTLNHAQAYVTSIALYDSMLRQRQTQTDTADGGRLLTETIYNTKGQVDEDRGPHYNNQPPSTSLVQVEVGQSARRIVYVYDGTGRVTDEIFYNRHVERWRTTTTYGGSSQGFLTSIQPPEGAPATATITNARGQTTEKRTYHSNTPTGAYETLTYHYTPTGQLETMTDQAGNQWSWDYDLRGRETTADDPDTGTTTMTYDVAGQLLGVTDARGQTQVFDYDMLGRKITNHDGDGVLLAEWEYDTAINGIGMPAKATRWHNGEAYSKWIRAYNPMGLVSQQAVILPASLGPLAGTHFFTYSHYPNGQLRSEGLPAIAGAAERGSLSHGYDRVGNPTWMIYQGQLTGTKVIVDQATYTPFNEIQTRTLGASYERQAWHGFVYEEDTRRLQRATFDRQATIPTVADVRYTYDNAGNVLSIADLPADLPGNHELQCFTYDTRRRLVEAWAQADTSSCATTPDMSILGGPAPYWHTYTHDKVGNRTGDTLRTPGQDPTHRTYTYPQAGQPQPHALQQVTTTSDSGNINYTYDPAGNTTTREVDGIPQTLTWNTEGHLEAVNEDGNQTTMIYDADGSRLIRDDGDTLSAFLPQTELVWNKPTDQVQGTRYFTHNGQVVATCTGQDVADWTWMSVDHHGTTATHSVNAFTGVEHVRRMDPYGNTRGAEPQTWPGQQGYVAGIHDPTGLIHIGARTYDPTIGRFITIDPILDTTDDQQINGYTYADNNPTTWDDPTGLCLPGCWLPDGEAIPTGGQSESSNIAASPQPQTPQASQEVCGQESCYVDGTPRIEAGPASAAKQGDGTPIDLEVVNLGSGHYVVNDLHVISEDPDFAHHLFLSAANIGNLNQAPTHMAGGLYQVIQIALTRSPTGYGMLSSQAGAHSPWATFNAGSQATARPLSPSTIRFLSGSGAAATSVAGQVLSDSHRDDLSPRQRAARVGAAGGIGLTAGVGGAVAVAALCGTGIGCVVLVGAGAGVLLVMGGNALMDMATDRWPGWRDVFGDWFRDTKTAIKRG